MKRALILGAAGAGFSAVGYFVMGSNQPAQAVTLQAENPMVVLQGSKIYQNNCASCHGANLEGQPNWRQRDAEGRLPAPPHNEDGHTWHHDSLTLFGLTKYGVAALINDPSYKSNMPAYEGILTDEEIIAVLSYIKSTWPEEIKAIHDEMERQR